MEAWDVVIVGEGHAAMRSAIAAKKEGASVLILSYIGPNNSENDSFCGIAAAISERSTKDHRNDTIRSGDFLCDQNVVNNRTSFAVENVAELEQWGVNFRRDNKGLPLMRLLPGHGKPRVVDCGDSTQREVYQVLSDQCTKYGVVRRAESHVVKLIHSNNTINGLVCLDLGSGTVNSIQAKSIIIADGGLEGAWNGQNSGGWGMHLAQEAGASLRDMEFQNWTPFAIPGSDLSLPINLLGDGATLQGPSNVSGSLTEMAITMSNAEGWSVDMTGLNQNNSQWFDGIKKLISIRLGLDSSSEPIPVEPRVNSIIGGIAVDELGQALSTGWDRTISGLFSCGAASCSGFHGGGQAVGNGLLEELVGGAQTGVSAAQFASDCGFSGTQELLSAADITDGSINADLDNSNSDIRAGTVRNTLSKIMSTHMGMNRDGKGLLRASESLITLEETSKKLSLDHSNSLLMNTNIVENYRLQAMINLSKSCVDAAINRKETRGTHNRLDYEGRDDENFLKHSIISSSGELSWIDLKRSDGGNWILAPGE